MKKWCFIWIPVILIWCTAASAMEIGGVSVPETLTADSHQLVLNGAGLRSKFFVKVYAGALYLTQKSSDAAAIIQADAPMAIRMHFIYDGVSSEKLVNAWNEGFQNSTGGNLAPIQSAVDQFNSYFSEEAKKGDIYDIIYTPEKGVSVHRKGALMGVIKGKEFKKHLFAIWLGKKPADSDLKAGMLGKK